MDAFIKEYLHTYRFVGIDSEKWKKFFLDYFQKEVYKRCILKWVWFLKSEGAVS